MANNDSATPITTGSVTGKPKERGIYYFKLGSEYFLYDEDEQRLCGLTGAEIDSNFHFLSGFDIKDVKITDSGNSIVITRVNNEYEPITLDLEEVRPNQLVYSAETGELRLVYPDGQELLTTGFFTDFNEDGKYNVKVYTDGTLDGLGSMYKPLYLSRLERTGTYAPVETLIEGPITDEYIGHRVLTREPVNDYGDLYAYPGLKAIQDALDADNSPWRIPTKADWDEMLNAMEETAKDHDEDSTGYKGESAGCLLKSTKYWDYGQNANVNHEEHDYVGLNILPVGYAAAGRGTTMSAEDFDVEEFGKNAGFWTRNTEENEEAWVKVFGAGFDSVRQYREETEDLGTLYSIRLIKECEPGCPEQYETILGDSYPVGPIVGCFDDYCKIWTLSNFYGKVGSGVTLNADEPHYAYFINECDGKKKRMMEGESIVILDSAINPDLHEYRIKNDVLVDSEKDIYNSINAASANIETRINTVVGETESVIDAVSASTNNLASELSAGTIHEIETLQGEINDIYHNAIPNAIRDLSAKTQVALDENANDIQSVNAALMSAEEELGNEIDGVSNRVADETIRATLAENALSNKIHTLSSVTYTLFESTDAQIGRINNALNDNENSSTSAHDKIDELSGIVETYHSDTVNDIQNIISSVASNVRRIDSTTDELREDVNAISAATVLNSEVLDNVIDEIADVESNLHTEINDVQTGLENIIDTLRNNLENEIANASGSSLQDAKDYTDEQVEAINSVKINDLYFDEVSKFIKLIKADGSLTNGIPAEEFLKDSVLTSVEFDEGNERLVFVWNDDYNTRTYIPLSKLSNVYGVSQDSLAFLKMSGTNISAIVDKADGFEKTLATTKFVEDGDDEVRRELTDISNTLTQEIVDLASATTATISELAEANNENREDIDRLNGDKAVPGSVQHTVDDTLNVSLLTAGLPVTTVSVDDAANNSLMRVLVVGNDKKYFVSNNARDMQATDNNGRAVSLNDYINSLENKITVLEAENTLLKNRVSLLERRVDDLASSGIDETGIKEIIKNYLTGTEREIKVAEDGENLRIGFEDDAVFGGYLAN